MKSKSSALKIRSYAICSSCILQWNLTSHQQILFTMGNYWDQARNGDHTNEVTINRGSTEYINYILYIYTVIIIYKYHNYVCLHA